MAWYSSRSRPFSGFAPYVPVAQRRLQAAKAAATAAKNGSGWTPVVIAGKKIAATFWGKAWCEHLESYSDYVNRLPRGRTYVRNGSVVDLQIAAGRITARVQGSSIYTESINIKPLALERWVAIKAACAGKITSLVGLLQGRLPDEVLRVITDRASGLFPAPHEIILNCSCPDSASLCKHLAAALYGVGARLDSRPELLFLLRGVDHQELVAEALSAVSRGPAGATDGTSAALADADLADVFGIDIASASVPVVTAGPSLAKNLPHATNAPALPALKSPVRGRPRAKTAPAKKSVKPTKSVPKVAVKPALVLPRQKQSTAVTKSKVHFEAPVSGKPRAKAAAKVVAVTRPRAKAASLKT